ncbi:MAG: leucine zipper domain-containing protein, partial [Gammaproteobacteria bacterium]|nr:leucine zipper domain-containing protein [Gammaproteobacteria bacterium]
DLCIDYGISRKTGYKWIQRFESTGIDGLNEQSRRPKSYPVQTPYRLHQAIIELRQQYQTMPGAKKYKSCWRNVTPMKSFHRKAHSTIS